ncbi:hypothetical protein [Selenomonas sp. CM52]|uniref:hypothetical protein n=1 Tax=Selenomonas sp. CM52 TaxID=936381 RepID=UPI00027C43E6|nr:hypothetical protein [Selenomonas sp. CM52]EJU25271.1 hypothetical protein HMPREF1153_2554 [Selenomonas sp. CM52]
MRAVFPAAVAVNLEDSAAMMALQPIDGFPLHKMKMAVPPLLAAGVGAEPPFLPAGNLLYRLAAAFANRNRLYGRSHFLLLYEHPTAEGLHSVLG